MSASDSRSSSSQLPSLPPPSSPLPRQLSTPPAVAYDRPQFAATHSHDDASSDYATLLDDDEWNDEIIAYLEEQTDLAAAVAVCEGIATAFSYDGAECPSGVHAEVATSLQDSQDVTAVAVDSADECAASSVPAVRPATPRARKRSFASNTVELELEIPVTASIPYSPSIPTVSASIPYSSSKPAVSPISLQRSQSPYLSAHGIPEKRPAPADSPHLLPLRFEDGTKLKNNSMLDTYRGGWKLNVTDLVQPFYCELKLFYQLHEQRFERPKYMVAGETLHKTLEDKFKKKIPMPTGDLTDEDVKALQLLNMLLSLSELTLNAKPGAPKEAGVTREFPVFGYIDDIYISGIIDELTYLPERYNPDGVQFIEEADGSDPTQSISKIPPLLSPMTQPERDTQPQSGMITDFFKPLDQSTPSGLKRLPTSEIPEISEISFQTDKVIVDVAPITVHAHDSAPQEKPQTPRLIRITDSKTRMHRSFPSESQRKSVYYQLLIYNRLFRDLTKGLFDFARFAAHMQLDPTKKLSDTFRNEVLSDAWVIQTLYKEAASAGASATLHKDDNYISLLHKFDTLGDIWAMLELKLSEFADAVSDELAVVYLWQGDGQVFGGIDFTYKPADVLKLQDIVFPYWRGLREPKGVEVEEAYKCRGCIFANECLWRLQKVNESAKRNRENFRRKYASPEPRAQARAEAEEFGQLVIHYRKH
ncbi:exonuclease V [Limtongia smithiae]|uniref:exonuclease V n=1 Tax=Limtongia smithiae TaxID=1125753 RepID=UPI0034CF17A2